MKINNNSYIPAWISVESRRLQTKNKIWKLSRAQRHGIKQSKIHHDRQKKKKLEVVARAVFTT